MAERQGWNALKIGRQPARPMLQRCFYRLEILRESGHGIARIPFGQSRKGVRISNTEMPFNPIIHPGETKNLNRPRAARAIGVAVETPVEKHVSRLDFRAPRKTGFYKGAGQDHACISFQMTVAGGSAALGKCLEPNLS